MGGKGGWGMGRRAEKEKRSGLPTTLSREEEGGAEGGRERAFACLPRADPQRRHGGTAARRHDSAQDLCGAHPERGAGPLTKQFLTSWRDHEVATASVVHTHTI